MLKENMNAIRNLDGLLRPSRNAQYTLERGHYVFTLSVRLSVLLSVPRQHRLTRRRVTMAVGQHAVNAGESIVLCQHSCAKIEKHQLDG